MIGIDAEYIAFPGLAEVPLDIADPIDAIGRNPAERHASRKGALDHLGCKLRLGRKADVARHACGLQASRIVGPALRQIERPIDEGMAVTPLLLLCLRPFTWTSSNYQPGAQHPKSSAIHKLPADYPIFGTKTCREPVS